jgi:hypothetical protein
MKIAVMTRLLAKRNMDVNAAHFYSNQDSVYNLPNKAFSPPINGFIS